MGVGVGIVTVRPSARWTSKRGREGLAGRLGVDEEVPAQHRGASAVRPHGLDGGDLVRCGTGREPAGRRAAAPGRRQPACVRGRTRRRSRRRTARRARTPCPWTSGRRRRRDRQAGRTAGGTRPRRCAGEEPVRHARRVERRRHRREPGRQGVVRRRRRPEHGHVRQACSSVWIRRGLVGLPRRRDVALGGRRCVAAGQRAPRLRPAAGRAAGAAGGGRNAGAPLDVAPARRRRSAGPARRRAPWRAGRASSSRRHLVGLECTFERRTRLGQRGGDRARVDAEQVGDLPVATGRRRSAGRPPAGGAAAAGGPPRSARGWPPGRARPGRSRRGWSTAGRAGRGRRAGGSATSRSRASHRGSRAGRAALGRSLPGRRRGRTRGSR